MSGNVTGWQLHGSGGYLKTWRDQRSGGGLGAGVYYDFHPKASFDLQLDLQRYRGYFAGMMEGRLRFRPLAALSGVEVAPAVGVGAGARSTTRIVRTVLGGEVGYFLAWGAHHGLRPFIRIETGLLPLERETDWRLVGGLDCYHMFAKEPSPLPSVPIPAPALPAVEAPLYPPSTPSVEPAPVVEPDPAEFFAQAVYSQYEEHGIISRERLYWLVEGPLSELVQEKKFSAIAAGIEMFEQKTGVTCSMEPERAEQNVLLILARLLELLHQLENEGAQTLDRKRFMEAVGNGVKPYPGAADGINLFLEIYPRMEGKIQLAPDAFRDFGIWIRKEK